MGGAIYQLNIKGPQDVYLTGNSQYNFIKQVYKRHVNFATQRMTVSFKNQVDFGRKIEINIPRKADFLYKLFFKFSLPPLTKTSGNYAGWTNSIGHVLIDYVDITIGEHIIDRHYGLFLEIWNEITQRPSLNSADHLLIGKYNHLESLEYNALTQSFYEVPLQFWFCNNIGSALPLINLQFHSVKLIFKLRPFEECIIYDGITPPNTVSISNSSLLAEYIFIEDSERIKYHDKEHTFLINQIQSINGESASLNSGALHKSLLNFNHPCSELFFVLREQLSDDNNDWFNFSQRITTVLTPVPPLIQNAKLLLDGYERIEKSDEFTLRIGNSYRYHGFSTNKHIYTISFCNEPEKWYPTGSMNFSLIDQAELQIQMASGIISPVKIYVFAKNYNIIHIKKGMVQLGFSN